MAPISGIKKSDLMQQLDTNFVTAFLCCGAAVNAITRSGQGGRIVNTAARPALEWRSGAGMTAYAASKAAVAAFTAALAVEVVKVIDHQPARLRQRAVRRVGEPVQSFEPGAIAEMKSRDRVDRRTGFRLRMQEVPGGRPQQRFMHLLARLLILPPVRPIETH